MSLSKISIISAVGHETDWTICDFVADMRAPTPSAAVEQVFASSEELLNQITALSGRARRAIEFILNAHISRLESLRRALHDPRTMLGHLVQRTDDLTGRLELALTVAVARRRALFDRMLDALRHNGPEYKIDVFRQRIMLLMMRSEGLLLQRLDAHKQAFYDQAVRLEVLSPLKTLAHGYAIASRADIGSVVSDAASLTISEQLHQHRIHARRVGTRSTGKT